MGGNVHLGDFGYVPGKALIHLIVGAVSFSAEAIPFRRENTFAANGFEASTHAANASEQIYKSE